MKRVIAREGLPTKSKTIKRLVHPRINYPSSEHSLIAKESGGSDTGRDQRTGS